MPRGGSEWVRRVVCELVAWQAWEWEEKVSGPELEIICEGDAFVASTRSLHLCLCVDIATDMHILFGATKNHPHPTPVRCSA